MGNKATGICAFAHLMTAGSVALTTIASDSTAPIRIRLTASGGDEVRWFEEMVPMRDGTRLYTYGALPPNGVKCGIVFTRTPYAGEQPVDVASANPSFAPHPNVAGDAFACANPKVARNTIFPERSFIELPCR